MKAEQQYIDFYHSSRDVIMSHSSALMNAHRDAACEVLATAGLPSRKVERYRYTDLQALFAPDYGLNVNRVMASMNPYEDFKCYVPHLSTSLFFVVNDSFVCSETASKTLPEGVIVDSLHRVCEERPQLIERYYNTLTDKNDGVCAMNTMLAQDGVFIYVPRNVIMERPIQVVNILSSKMPLMTNRRVIVLVEQGADAKILFCDHADRDIEFLSTQVTEVFVGENAALDMTCLEETHAKNSLVSNTYIAQERASRVHHNVITLHNGKTRNQLDLVFKGEGAECFLNGCAITDKQQHVDNNTVIDHKTGHCESHELYKYVLGEQSTGAFAGRVLVREDSQKTNSSMINQNICATKEARMYTQPMLEIYADDVKCSHGSTIGQLNDAALFYMQQRGVSRDEAKTLLQVAFITEVISSIQMPQIRERLAHLVEKRFRGELNKCEGCKLCL